jgi:hypothetical protein
MATAKINDTIAEGSAWTEGNAQTTWLGRFWRYVFQIFLLRTCDTINRLRLTRALLDYVNMLSAYESFVLGGLIRYLDVPEALRDPTPLLWALRNRNVCRILVREVTHNRWSWFFHVHQQLKRRKLFDLLGWLPYFGHYAALPSENYASSRWYSVWNIWDSFWERFRWHNDDGHNLTPEATGFEQAVRNHFGCHNGRIEFNKFRFAHRLTIDESIVRSFVANPTLTMMNNGVEHCLICMAKHWEDTLTEEFGNFAHQRQELLNPFETLRYHLPDVLLVLANLRGRCNWDAKVLAPLVYRLQTLNPARFNQNNQSGRDVEAQSPEVMVLGPCQAGKRLVQEILDTVVKNVCGGVSSRIAPLTAWLSAIFTSFDLLQQETESVRLFVESVSTGIQLGYSLMKVIDWSVPSDRAMQQAIVNFIQTGNRGDSQIPDSAILSALRQLLPKDERTLRELVKNGDRNLSIVKLLLERTTTLLIREIHRCRLDKSLRRASKGDPVAVDVLEKTMWYWVDAGQGYEVCMLSRKLEGCLKFVKIDTNTPVLYDPNQISCCEYLPIAESITRAQKAYMTIEIEHCKRFSINAYLEFGSGYSTNSLKTTLRRLLTVAQVFSPELDQARLRSLTEIRSSVAKRQRLSASRLAPECQPQNTVVVGGYVPQHTARFGLLC